MKIKNKIAAFSGVEILLASSIMTLLMVSLLGLLFYSRDSMTSDNLNLRASIIANEGLEAVSTIRDDGFENLIDGVYGLFFSDGKWSFLGENDKIDDFTRTITVSTISENVKKIAVAVNWFKSPGRLVGISLYKYFTNWKETETFTCDNWFGDASYFSYYQTICDKGDLIIAKKAKDPYSGLAGNGVSLKFSRASDYVETPLTASDLNIEGNKPKTIELWAKTLSFTNNEALFSFGAPASAGRDFSLRTLGSENNWRAQLWGAYDLDFTYNSLNKWVHFALVHDGTKTSVYADGNLVAERVQTIDTVADQVFRIAWWPYWSLPNTFNGQINEVRIWDKALSQTEIQSNLFKQMTGSESNLVAYWRLDEGFGSTAVDRVNSNNATLINGPIWTGDSLTPDEYFSEGNRISLPMDLDEFKNIRSSNISWLAEEHNLKTALNFNGSSDYVSVSNSTELNPANISLSAWVKWNIDPASGAQWASIINKNADNQYRLQHNQINTAFEFAIRTSTGGSWIVSQTAPVQGVWYNVVGTYDGSEMKLYVNGELEASTAYSGDILSSTSDLNIGRRSSNDRYFNGQIDEVRIWNRALSRKEILDNLYKEIDSPSSKNNLVAYFRFNEDLGLVATDDSKNANHGSLIFSGAEPYRLISQVFSKLDIYTAINNSNTSEPDSWTLVSDNNSSIPGFNIGENLTGKYLWIRQNLYSWGKYISPRLKSLETTIESDELILTQAEQLAVDSSAAQVNPANRNQVNGISFTNSGPDNTIIIERMRPVWSGVSSNRRLSSIVINGLTVWSGSAVSGTVLSLNSPFEVNLSSGPYSLIFNFSRTVDAIALYSSFEMADGSSKQLGLTVGGVEDTTPPSAISNLSSSARDHESITISWTAPGNDGSVGLASYYEIRYSQNPINDSNWETADLFSNPPLPEIAGTTQSVKIDGFTPSTSYYFAIKTFDENDNASPLSNVLNQSTTALPQSTYLQIDMSGAVIGPSPLNNTNVSGIILNNNGSENIRIRSIKGSWTGPNLRQIYINGVSIWSGNINSSGTATFSTPYTLTTTGGPYNLRLRFQSNFTGRTINYLDFTLFDNSVKRSTSKSF